MRLFQMLIRIASRMENSLCLFVNSMEAETREIARGLRRRDPDLLDELIGRYQYRLPRYLWTLTGSREAAEDLFQETWIRVLEKGHLYDPRWRFEAWLFSIARNLAIDLLRRRQPESLEALLHPDEERSAREWPDCESATPFETAAAGEQAEHVKGVLRRLPPDAREVLVLRFQEDMELGRNCGSGEGPALDSEIAALSRPRGIPQSPGGGRGMNPEYSRARPPSDRRSARGRNCCPRTRVAGGAPSGMRGLPGPGSANEHALQALRSNSVSVDPALVSTTQARVRLRARELRENQVRMRALWISCALSWVLGVASAPLVWRAFHWIGLHAALPKMIWESAFALWWLLPAGCGGGSDCLATAARREPGKYTTLPR